MEDTITAVHIYYLRRYIIKNTGVKIIIPSLYYELIRALKAQYDSDRKPTTPDSIRTFMLKMSTEELADILLIKKTLFAPIAKGGAKNKEPKRPYPSGMRANITTTNQTTS